MSEQREIYDLSELHLKAGEGRTLELQSEPVAISFSDQPYEVAPTPLPVRVDLTKMVGGGWSGRMRFTAEVHGPCMRCLQRAGPAFTVDSREVDAPDGGPELDSPYFDGDRMMVSDWSRDALALELPAQILCRPDCLGLCPACGIDLNEDPGHAHEREPDSRWAKLDELKFTDG